MEPSLKRTLPTAAACLTLLLAISCSTGPETVEPAPPPFDITDLLTRYYDEELYDFLKPPEGVSTWRWTIRTPAGDLHRGIAVLVLESRCIRWTLLDSRGDALQAPPDSGRLGLLPMNPAGWHDVRAPWPPAPREVPLPLPRIPVRSPMYADLLDLLQDLLQVRDRRCLRRWPALPVPVRAPAARSGEVDLQLCLRAAASLWNAGEPDSLFRWDPAAEWGVRLIFLPAETAPPPFTVKVVRLNGQGGPLRVHVLAGACFTRPDQQLEAVRELVRALGRALMMQGESRDPGHVLAHDPGGLHPAADERNAARLLSRLPSGLDLCGYRRPARILQD
jgi:hypothetical protein